MSFDDADDGLYCYKPEINGFQIAGIDKIFYPATAVIYKNKMVMVWNEHVKKPIAVRYNCVTGEQLDISLLPASSFRTDWW